MKVILENNFYSFSIIPETDFEITFLEKFMEFRDRVFKLYPCFGKKLKATFIEEVKNVD